MGNRRKVPEDLMGTILGEGSGARGEERTLLDSRGLRGAGQQTGSPSLMGEGTVSWEEHPERVGITFNLSKQLSTELDKLRLELEGERDVRTSKSEIAEEALRIALEDVQRGGRESELVKRLSGWQVSLAKDELGNTFEQITDEELNTLGARMLFGTQATGAPDVPDEGGLT